MQTATFMGNSPIDILQETPLEKISEYGLKLGDFQGTDADMINRMQNECGEETLCPGGALANTTWSLGKLGHKANFIGRVGDDKPGNMFFNSMKDAGLAMPKPESGKKSMEIRVLVTPNGERTFATTGIPSPMTQDFIPHDMISHSDWLFVEGYLLLDPAQIAAVKESITVARNNGLKIAMTLATVAVMDVAFDHLAEEIIGHVDLIIGNEDEYRALINAAEHYKHEAAELLAQKLQSTPRLVTHGEKGASFLDSEGNKTFEPCPPVAEVIDTTGAGDAFLAGFLDGFLQSKPIPDCLKQGHAIASMVVQQMGGRYPHVGAHLYENAS
jgi:sugar/nucleoside kinase (ribokinase family)